MVNHVRGSVTPCDWDDSFKNLTYHRRIFGSPETIQEWETIGHNSQSAIGYQMPDISSYFDWAKQVCTNFPLDNISDQIFKMPPGSVIPLHVDPYRYFMEVNNIDDINQLCRAVVFLEDWQSGHYLEVDGESITNYKKGDYVMWKGPTPHLVANVGNHDRYTMILTGVRNENTQL